MSNINNKNIEQWMFDYTEGNLSENEQRQLMQFIEDHPHYKEDLNLWTMSYIKSPLPEIKFEKLTIKESYFNKNFYKYLISLSIIAILIATMFYFNENKKPVSKAFSPKQIIKATPLRSKNNLPQQKDSIQVSLKSNNFLKKVNYNGTISKNKFTPTPSPPDINFLKDTFTSPAVKDSLNNNIDSSFNVERNSTAPSVKKEVKNKIFTKRELRQIEKAKNRAKERRREEELMKGNKPYIVPFNNGF